MYAESFATALLLIGAFGSSAAAWSESGHHIITLLAYDLLSEAERTEIQTVLAGHPRYSQDFSPPKNIRSSARWRVGCAGYWPDIARSQPEYNRPTWHYQLGATLVIGDKKKLEVPVEPGPMPDDANLDVQEMHIAQAIDLCRRVISDAEQPVEDRAIALCWLAHLVADAHQPCHAGSLYVVEIFEHGDKGANAIETKQANNLHALWDRLLGNRFDEGDVQRRCQEITEFSYNKQLLENSLLLDCQDQVLWLRESREYARKFVYTQEIMHPIEAVRRGLAEELPVIDLPEEYLKNAGNIAKVRAYQAAQRLSDAWRIALRSSRANPITSVDSSVVTAGEKTKKTR